MLTSPFLSNGRTDLIGPVYTTSGLHDAVWSKEVSFGGGITPNRPNVYGSKSPNLSVFEYFQTNLKRGITFER